MLAELRASGLPVSEVLRRRLVEVVRENVDAFAATPTDLGRTSVVIHTIKTRDSKPFKHKLRPIPFARRQYLEQEVEKLLEVHAISPADLRACPYASRTVFSPKKDGTLRMCIDYRDLNAQTEKDAFPLPRIDQIWPLWRKQNILRHWTCSWFIIKWKCVSRIASSRLSSHIVLFTCITLCPSCYATLRLLSND